MHLGRRQRLHDDFGADARGIAHRDRNRRQAHATRSRLSDVAQSLSRCAPGFRHRRMPPGLVTSGSDMSPSVSAERNARLDLIRPAGCRRTPALREQRRGGLAARGHQCARAARRGRKQARERARRAAGRSRIRRVLGARCRPRRRRRPRASRRCRVASARRASAAGSPTSSAGVDADMRAHPCSRRELRERGCARRCAQRPDHDQRAARRRLAHDRRVRDALARARRAAPARARSPALPMKNLGRRRRGRPRRCASRSSSVSASQITTVHSSGAPALPTASASTRAVAPHRRAPSASGNVTARSAGALEQIAARSAIA